jgi:hypothetical protein
MTLAAHPEDQSPLSLHTMGDFDEGELVYPFARAGTATPAP